MTAADILGAFEIAVLLAGVSGGLGWLELTEAQLNAELVTLQIAVPQDQVARLFAYYVQLLEWNDRLNLTRHTDLAAFAARDVLDSFQLAQCLQPNENILDVGTGGGVPGVLVAILRPDIRVSLSETVGKKAAAVKAIVAALKLSIPVHATRGEQIVQHQRFDSVVMRAVGPLEKVLPKFEPLASRFGRLLMIKGPKWTEERGAARHVGALAAWDLRRLASYRPPGHFGDSVILSIAPRSDRSETE